MPLHTYVYCASTDFVHVSVRKLKLKAPSTGCVHVYVRNKGASLLLGLTALQELHAKDFCLGAHRTAGPVRKRLPP